MIPYPGAPAPVQVQWFPAQPNADFMFPTAFGSSIWDNENENLNVDLGEIRGSRIWCEPQDIPYLGTGPCGKEIWWRQGVPVSEPQPIDGPGGIVFAGQIGPTRVRNSDGQLACCGGQFVSGLGAPRIMIAGETVPRFNPG
jgi:hypothetical protein